MFVIQRMASSSHPLFTSSLRFHSPSSLLFNPIVKQQFYRPNFQSFCLFKKPHHRFLSSPAAVAVDPGTAIAADDRNASDDLPKEVEKVVLPTNESSQTLLRIRHTCAHVMAMAVQKVFPDAKVTIGPWIEHGFYYDFDIETLTDKDLKKIKKEMDRIIGRNLPLIREEVTRDEAEKTDYKFKEASDTQTILKYGK